MPKLRITHEFFGFIDFWGGNGRRWDDDAGCLFVFPHNCQDFHEIVSDWLDDYELGGDFESFPPEIDRDDVENAINQSDLIQRYEDMPDIFDLDCDDQPVWVILVELV